MTIDQIRDAIAWVESNHARALEGQAYGLAEKLWEKREALWCDLRSAIQELEDNQPDWNRQWYDTSAELR